MQVRAGASRLSQVLVPREHYNKFLAQAEEAKGLILSARLTPTGEAGRPVCNMQMLACATLSLSHDIVQTHVCCLRIETPS